MKPPRRQSMNEVPRKLVTVLAAVALPKCIVPVKYVTRLTPIPNVVNRSTASIPSSNYQQEVRQIQEKMMPTRRNSNPFRINIYTVLNGHNCSFVFVFCIYTVGRFCSPTFIVCDYTYRESWRRWPIHRSQNDRLGGLGSPKHREGFVFQFQVETYLED